MKGLVICFWVVKVRQRTQSCHCMSPVADGDTPSTCLHLIRVHVQLARTGEREEGGGGSAGSLRGEESKE